LEQQRGVILANLDLASSLVARAYMPGPTLHTAARGLLLGLALAGVAGCNTAVAPGDDDDNDDSSAPPDSGAQMGGGPRVIIMIGDGMGQAQLDAASLYAHGATGELFMQSLPMRGALRSAGPSGTTDSAAAATVMASGVYTFNGALGLDRDDAPVELLVETAQARGLATGVVTTTMLVHATPAGFTSHVTSRGQVVEIADQQVRVTRPEVMLGGGARYYRPAGDGSAREDDGLFDDLDAAGYQIVETASELAAAEPDGPLGNRLFGAFAADHLSYVLDRDEPSSQPTLTEMSLRAIDFLDGDPEGFFLMIEGGRIDHAGHANDLADNVHETLAFDDAIRAVVEWASTRPDVTVIVTADHECGGLEIIGGYPAGIMPDVRWRWGGHTNARVGIFGVGPGTEVFDGAVVDHRWVHAIASSRITGAPFAPPPVEIIPDGDLHDLRWLAAAQAQASSFGVGYNQLDALYLDADARGLSIGIEGVFEWDENAVVVLLDVDHGGGTGAASMLDAADDVSHPADTVVSGLNLLAPSDPDFGADLVLVSVGGADPKIEQLKGDGGLRGLRAPYGSATDLGWFHTAINYEGVRGHSVPTPGIERGGFEAFIAWSELFPALGGSVPPGTTIAIAAVLVNSDGGYTSNQALPPFPEPIEAGRDPIALPGVVLFAVDSDADGVADGDSAPTVIAPLLNHADSGAQP
jgi:alkaline phosphatase